MVVESEDKNIGKVAEFATQKPDGNLFWLSGVYEKKDETHFYFRVKGATVAVLRSAVIKINFGNKEGV
jgi:hypothetical protein